jgi:hypothetical protein
MLELLNTKHAVKYVNDRKGRKYGVVVAIKSGDKVLIGASRCNLSKEIFRKKDALNVAVNRALKWPTREDHEGHKLDSFLTDFLNQEDEYKFIEAINYVTDWVNKPKRTSETYTN